MIDTPSALALMRKTDSALSVVKNFSLNTARNAVPRGACLLVNGSALAPFVPTNVAASAKHLSLGLCHRRSHQSQRGHVRRVAREPSAQAEHRAEARRPLTSLVGHQG